MEKPKSTSNDPATRRASVDVTTILDPLSAEKSGIVSGRKDGAKRAASKEAAAPVVIDTEGDVAEVVISPVPAKAKAAKATRSKAVKTVVEAKAKKRGRSADESDAEDGDTGGDTDESDAEDEDEDSEADSDDELDAIDGPSEGELSEGDSEAAFSDEFSDDERPPKATGSSIVSARGALSINDPLGAYMREVQRHPLLTRTEEHQLAVVYHETGDVDAAKKLVTSNLRLVVKIAYEYKRAHRNMMDLVQEGNIGLMQAVRRYDPHRGVKLSSYSAWWIRAYILRFILNNWRLVKLGTTQAQRKLFFNLNKERARLAAMGIEPTHEEIAKRLDVEAREVQEMDLRLASNDASLDVPVGDSDSKASRLDMMASSNDGPERLAENGQLLGMLREHLQTFRETLAGKDLEIFDKRMIADEPVTLQELGDHFGVSRERVRQLEARISGKLRTFLYQCLGDAVSLEAP